MKKHQWTQTETEFLLKHWEGSKTALGIASGLGLKAEQVINKAKALRLGGRATVWSEVEADYLLELATCYLFEDLVKTYNHTAKLNKWQRRTVLSIQNKLKQLGVSRSPKVGFITIKIACRLLGRGRKWVEMAIASGKLQVVNQGTSIFIEEQKFLLFCLKFRQEVAEKMTREGVEFLLRIMGDREALPAKRDRV